MHPWAVRIIVIILAIAFVPIIVGGVADLVAGSVNTLGEGIGGFFDSLSESSNARVESLLKLALYIVFITILIRVL